MLRKLVLALSLLVGGLAQADAATCFWVGGTGNWNDAAKWSSSTGGSGSTCAATSGIPKNAGDIATLDASSGGGTATIDIASLSLAQITMGAFGGTLTDSGNAVTLTTALSCTGTGTRTLTMTGTWTLSGSGNVFDCSVMTNMTLNASSATVVTNYTGLAQRNMTFGSAATIGTLTIGANGPGTAGGSPLIITGPGSATLTINTVNIAGPAMFWLQGSSARAYAFTNGFSWTGGPTAPIMFGSTPGSTSSSFPILTSANAMTCAWCVLTGMRFAGNGNLTATNSFDFGGLSISSGSGSISITPPSIGGGHVIGG